jgi:2-dehydro-3-deoxy-D-gluconate 5-dehydrogenase
MSVPAGEPAGSLTGRRIMVTGASRGIGRAVAMALMAQGAALGLVSRSLSDLELMAGEIRSLGGTAAAAAMDVTDADSVERATEAIVAELGGLDVLVNNSGVLVAARTLDTSVEEWDRVLNTNLRGTFLCCRAAGRYLVGQGSGKVINIASSFGLKPVSGFAAYAASKAGILQLTKVLALEWAKDNVQVNAIAPGYVITDMNNEIRADEAFEAKVLQRIPARRMAAADEIGPLAVLLASSASDYLTGSVLVVDGGQSL